MGKIPGVLFIIVLLVGSCSDKHPEYPFSQLSYGSIDSMKNAGYTISNRRICSFIDSFRLSEKDSAYVDIITNRYYAERQPYLWINRWGADHRADTLLQWITEAVKEGIPERRFYAGRIRESLQRLRSRNFDSRNTVSRTLATLEYYLTKSYLRYTSGQSFGFVNPEKLYNHLEQVEPDSLQSPYRTLFAIPIESLDKQFLSYAFRELREHHLGQFLKEVQPTSPLYKKFVAELQQTGPDSDRRRSLEVNLERSRWRMKQENDGRYILVNLPAQQLQLFEEEKQVLVMKICIGSLKHKTPLLTSSITHLDLNPYWIVPKSIVRHDILSHIGDTAYFNRKRFKIVERKTGTTVSPLDATAAMLLDKEYLVRQENGSDNSLGQVIFRFPNPCSIYLHDSNNKEAFGRSTRMVSHGCIRLEKPYELAVSLVGDGEDKYAARIRRALGLDENGRPAEDTDNNEKKSQERCPVDPPVPLYIIYYTAYPDEEGHVKYYPDLYSYDNLIWQHLHKP